MSWTWSSAGHVIRRIMKPGDTMDSHLLKAGYIFIKMVNVLNNPNFDLR